MVFPLLLSLLPSSYENTGIVRPREINSCHFTNIFLNFKSIFVIVNDKCRLVYAITKFIIHHFGMINLKISNADLGRIDSETFKAVAKTPVILVLDNVRSLFNIGSIFRTADAFACEAIYLCGVSGTPPHKEIEKTALGATETVDWKYFKTTEEAVKNLKANDYSIFAVEQAENKTWLQDIKTEANGKYALVLGNEVYGVEQAIVNTCDGVIEIPQSGTKHSLNVAVSAGIVVWKFYEALNKKL
jgi:23S rRNA (guanosine2251-2'-O)-methyltransferase